MTKVTVDRGFFRSSLTLKMISVSLSYHLTNLRAQTHNRSECNITPSDLNHKSFFGRSDIHPEGLMLTVY